MDFGQWWKDYIGGDKHKSLVDGRTYAKSAWDYQQDRIAKLEAEVRLLEQECENAKTYMVRLSKALTDEAAENQRLRDAIKVMKDNTFTMPGMVCHKMVGESELFAVFEAALLEGE